MDSNKFLDSIKSWTQSDVAKFLEKNDLKDLVKFVELKRLTGSELLNLTDEIIGTWTPKVDPCRLIEIIKDLKTNPDKYVKTDAKIDGVNVVVAENHKIQDSGGVVKRQKPKPPKRVDSLIKENFTVSDEIKNSEKSDLNNIELATGGQTSSTNENKVNLENIVPPKSFLYSDKLINAISKLYPYLPMKVSQDGVLKKKSPFRFSGAEMVHETKEADYYEMSVRKSLNRSKSYSDSCVNGENNYEELLFKSKKSDKSSNKRRFAIFRRVLRRSTFRWNSKSAKSTSETNNNARSRFQKINDMVVKKLNIKIVSSNYKMTSPSNTEDLVKNSVKSVKFKQISDNNRNSVNPAKDIADVEKKIVQNTNQGNEDIPTHYEEPDYSKKEFFKTNKSDLVLNENYYEEADMFFNPQEEDVIIDVRDSDSSCRVPIEVEDYLEPIQCFSSITSPVKAIDNLAEEIIKLFDANMEATDVAPIKDSHSNNNDDPTKEYLKHQENPLTGDSQGLSQISIPQARLPKPKVPARGIKKLDNKTAKDQMDVIQETDDRPFDTLQKWNESLKSTARRKKEATRRSMLDRPLPIPVENEFYYMEVGRKEAEELLEGHANGTFILRPSSQSSHLYTVTLIYEGRIYNIGCRRRPDGRLALGFSKPGEQNFLTIHQLIQHYYTERLLLIQDGVKVGSTTLRKLDGN